MDTTQAMRLHFTEAQRTLIWNALQDKCNGDRRAADEVTRAGVPDLGQVLLAQSEEAAKLADFFL